MAGTEENMDTMQDAQEEGGTDGTEEDRGSGVKFPLGRIKRIMKADPDLNIASQDAVFLIAKAVELFVESVAQEAYQYTSQARKKTIARRDVDACIESIDALAFLDGAME